MNTLTDAFLTVLVNASAAGQPLVAAQGSIFGEANDTVISELSAFPIIILRPVPPQATDACRGSEWVIYDATIFVMLAHLIDRQDSTYESAREAVETLRANLERVLIANRARTDLAWSRMTFGTIEAGGFSPTDTPGPFDLQGLPVYRHVIGCDFHYARQRAA